MTAEVARVPDEQDEGLGRLARLLTGEARLAAELLGEVAVLDVRTPHGDDDRYADRRALLVQRVLRRRRRGAPSPGAEPDPVESPGVVARLALLDPLSRTLLVLRHGEHLTLAELARITDRSPSAVTRTLEQAETVSNGDRVLEPYEIEQGLWDAAAPEPGAVREAERRFAARRRRARTRVVLAGLAAVGLVVGLSALPGLLRTDPYARPYGTWTSAVRLPSQDRFAFQARQLSASEEVLSVTMDSRDGSNCSVTVTTARARVTVPAGRVATVGERPARFVAATDEADPGLWWSVGPRTSALAQCDADADDATLLDLAGQVQFAPEPVRVPFDLRSLPSGDEVHTFLDFGGTVGVLVTPRGESEESPEAVFVGLIASSDAGAVSGRTVDINGTTGRLTDDEDETTVCWASGLHTVCASMINQQSTDDRPQQVRRRSRVLETARAVRLVADVDDRAGWLDAADAFPR